MATAPHSPEPADDLRYRRRLLARLAGVAITTSLYTAATEHLVTHVPGHPTTVAGYLLLWAARGAPVAGLVLTALRATRQLGIGMLMGIPAGIAGIILAAAGETLRQTTSR